MRYFDYDQHDALFEALRSCRRLEQAKHLPQAGTNLTTEAADFWGDVRARFTRGEWADAITAIERRFEARRNWPDDDQLAVLIGKPKRRAA